MSEKNPNPDIGHLFSSFYLFRTQGVTRANLNIVHQGFGRPIGGLTNAKGHQLILFQFLSHAKCSIAHCQETNVEYILCETDHHQVVEISKPVCYLHALPLMHEGD